MRRRLLIVLFCSAAVVVLHAGRGVAADKAVVGGIVRMSGVSNGQKIPAKMGVSCNFDIGKVSLSAKAQKKHETLAVWALVCVKAQKDGKVAHTNRSGGQWAVEGFAGTEMSVEKERVLLGPGEYIVTVTVFAQLDRDPPEVLDVSVTRVAIE